MTHKSALKKNIIQLVVGLVLCGIIIAISCISANAASIQVGLESGEAQSGESALDLLFLLAMIALLPSLLLVMTSFTRIIISLSFLRSAIGTQSSPPNQVLVGFSLFMTIFIMFPTFSEIKTTAYDPFKKGEITQTEAIKQGSVPLKEFMLKQIYEEDLDLFLSLADSKDVVDVSTIQSQEDLKELSMVVIIPSFITSELKRAFMIGFLLYIPFLIIDIIVSSTLMSMGMVMLPPSTIALPFKLMLFVLVDGWNLLIEALISGFR